MVTGRRPGNLTIEVPPLLDRIKALEPQIRAAAASIDADRCLPDDLIEALRRTGLFRASWPRSLGGSELDPITQMQALEELARMDGSVGWVGAFAAIGGLLAAHLDPAAAEELFKDADVVSAGSYGPIGRGERVPGGYRLSGTWGFGSGCRHADVISAGFLVTVDGEIQQTSEGQPEYRVAMFPKSGAAIDLASWDVTGLRGTGSHDYTVTDLFVPEAHTFDDLDPPRHEGPLYAYHGLFLYSHIPLPLGLAQAALDYIYELGNTKRVIPGTALLKEHGSSHEAVAQAEAALRSARSWAYDLVGAMWDAMCRGVPLSKTQRAEFRLCGVHVTRTAREIVLAMHDLAGSSAIQRTSVIDRILRDTLAASAHRIVSWRIYRPAGKVLFGGEVKNDRYFL